MKILKNIYEQAELKYNTANENKKNIYVLSTFVIILMIVAKILLLNSWISYNDNENLNEELIKTLSITKNENTAILLNISKNSKQNIENEKNKLKKEVDLLISNNKEKFKSINSTINYILNNNDISILSFNANNKKINNTYFIENGFVINVTGNYNDIYKFIEKINNENNINIEQVKIERNEKRLEANIDFTIKVIKRNKK